jgi:uncharacterized protein HemX
MSTSEQIHTDPAVTARRDTRQGILVLLAILAVVAALAASGFVFGLIGVVFPMLAAAAGALIIMVVFSFG